MKITVWGINYAPEPTGIGPFNADMCAWLAERGHDVTMLTSFPYYPWWKKRDADRGKIFSRETNPGGAGGCVEVRRCWHYVPARPSTLRRLAHELSFVATSTVRALTMRAPDVFVVVGPPLFLGIGAWIASRVKRRPFVFHVQDLQPDAALGLGMIKPGATVRALYALERRTYRSAALVTGISEGMMSAFRRKHTAGEKIFLFPNWIPDAEDATSARNSATHGGAEESFRAAHGIARETALFAYSGNIGVKQGLEVVVDAAALGGGDGNGGGIDDGNGDGDRNGGEHWAICGDGAAKPALEARATAAATAISTARARTTARATAATATAGVRGAKFYPLQTDALYHGLLRDADVNLITQQRGTGQFFFPSKLLSILQHGRPVLAVADADSELARAVREGRFGKVVPPGDAAALRAAALELAHADAARKNEYAANARAWVAQFRRTRVLSAFEERLARVAARPRG